jgi:tetratricopeptide (TPR) repeat protein
MPSKLNRWALVALLAFAVVAAACAGTDEEADMDAERQVALEEIQQLKQDLDDLRVQIADAEAAADGTAADGDAAADEAEAEMEDAGADAAADLAQLRSRFEDTFSELHAAIGRYFQEVDPLIQGEAPNERQQAVLRINSDEAIINAGEYIRQGGDYRGAINALNAALTTDPDNAELQAAVAEAEEMRYMTEERFSVVEKGMTQAEVRAEIGIPHHANRRTFDNGAEGWFFPVDPEGSAAAVYFEERRGEMVVFRVNFEEVVKGDGAEDA